MIGALGIVTFVLEHSLYVSSKHRRKGIASKLLQETMKNARKMEVSEIHITTRFDNKPAINLYKKHGLVKNICSLKKSSNSFSSQYPVYSHV